jgi:hypothetical protein
MIAPTWITPGCVQFLESKKCFHTACSLTGPAATPAQRVRSISNLKIHAQIVSKKFLAICLPIQEADCRAATKIAAAAVTILRHRCQWTF